MNSSQERPAIGGKVDGGHLCAVIWTLLPLLLYLAVRRVRPQCPQAWLPGRGGTSSKEGEWQPVLHIIIDEPKCLQIDCIFCSIHLYLCLCSPISGDTLVPDDCRNVGGKDHGVLRRAQGQDEVKNPALNCEVPQPSAHFKLSSHRMCFKKTVPQETFYAKPKFILAEGQKNRSCLRKKPCMTFLRLSVHRLYSCEWNHLISEVTGLRHCDLTNYVSIDKSTVWHFQHLLLHQQTAQLSTA